MESNDLADWIGGLRAFAAVGQRLSFVAAARDLDLSRSALSRRIAQLEEALGTRLVQRTTRRVALTEAGALYLERCLDLLARFDEANAAASAFAKKARGHLRISLPNLFGQLWIAPLIPEFAARHPQVTLELLFSDRVIDLVAERIDIGVRIGALETGQFIARKLAPNERILCAAPSYLERFGWPRTPGDLTRHRLLHFGGLVDGPVWRLRKGRRVVDLPISPVLQSDNAGALRLAVIAGMGVAHLATFIVASDLRTGQLVRVLPDFSLGETWICAVYPNARFLPLKTQAFRDFLLQRFAGAPPWERADSIEPPEPAP